MHLDLEEKLPTFQKERELKLCQALVSTPTLFKDLISLIRLILRKTLTLLSLSTSKSKVKMKSSYLNGLL